MGIKTLDLKLLKKEEQFYIFGAGLVGKLTLQYLKKTCPKTPLGFLVSALEDSPGMVGGVPVCEVDEEIDRDAAVIIAVLPESQKEIEDFLEKRGFHKIFSVDETLFQRMRRREVSRKDETASQKLRFSELLLKNSVHFQKTLLVSDHVLPETLRWKKGITVIQTDEFIHRTVEKEKYETVMIFLPDWSFSLEKMVERVNQYEAKCFLSLRSRYMLTKTYDFVKDIKKRGLQISAYRNFRRPEWEYNTEDVLVLLEKRSVASLERDQLCSGCGKCVVECPEKALSLKPDINGNYRPFVNRTKCKDCGQCIKTCPVYHEAVQPADEEAGKECYAYMADSELRGKSSSGGAFGVLAGALLREQGYVCGAAWNKDYSVEHIVIHDEEDLALLQRSKYLRSDITNAFKEIYELAENGEKILFSGCPCQVAAMREHLGEWGKNVLFMDLLCTQAPSDVIFQKYLKENYEVRELKEIGFREKSNGWRPDSFYIILKDGRRHVRGWEDSYQKAYHSKLMMPFHCEHCAFSGFPRAGDITIGDFWGIREYDMEMDDMEGTSVVLINTEKGARWRSVLENAAAAMKKEPVEWVETHNRIGNWIEPHESRDRFYDEVFQSDSYNRTVDSILEKRFDVALAGNWSYPNYGTELTYYALYRQLKKMGFSVCLIEWPEDSPWKPYGCTQLFQKEPYKNSEIAHKAADAYAMRKYNRLSERFLHGSDQLLSPLHYWALQKSALMPWVDIDKTKIGYAFSFGKDTVTYDAGDKETIGLYLRNFDALSVREESAAGIMRETFGIDAFQALDPVFFLEAGDYEDLMPPEGVQESEDCYLFAYILDWSNEKVQKLKTLADGLDTALIIILDGELDGQKIDFSGCRLFSGISVNEWLYFLKKSEYVVTDSFHGTCLSIIFRKKFMSIVNERRGGARFVSLANILGLGKRMVSSADEITVSGLREEFDYSRVERILKTEIEKSGKWLLDGLTKGKTSVLSDTESILRDKYRQLEQKLNEIAANMGEQYDVFF